MTDDAAGPDEKTRTMDGWIGVDLDGTLCRHFEAPEDLWTIPPPIPRMVERVKGWIAEGKQIRIFTARVGCCGERSPLDLGKQRTLIEAWCLEHLGQVLPVTATKDFLMTELWDDRATQVVTDTGMTLEETLTAGIQVAAMEIARAIAEPPA